MTKKKIIIKGSVLRQLIKESFDRVMESGHEGWREEDWNPNYPDDNEEDPDEEPFDFDETYYKSLLNENDLSEEKRCEILLRLGAVEQKGMGLKQFLSQRGKQVVKNGGYVCQWTIDIGNRAFHSKHNFSNENATEKNCNKYLKAIGNIFDEATVFSIWVERGKLMSDELLVNEGDFWMD